MPPSGMSTPRQPCSLIERDTIVVRIGSCAPFLASQSGSSCCRWRRRACVVGATQETARQRESAVVEATVATSAGLRSSERDVAALLAVEAYRRWPDDARSRGALLGMFTAADGFLGNRYITGADRIAGAVIPGTENAVVVRDNESAAVVDLNNGHVLRELEFGAPRLDAAACRSFG